jgi:hypothetical protein
MHPFQPLDSFEHHHRDSILFGYSCFDRLQLPFRPFNTSRSVLS